MSDEATPRFQGNGPMVSMTVKDLKASLRFYHEVVGFGITQRYEHEGEVRTVALNAGGVIILLNQDDGAKGWDRIKGQGLSMTITTEDVDAVAAAIKAAGGTLEAEPEDKPWGARMFPLTDPDGFKWSISTPMM